MAVYVNKLRDRSRLLFGRTAPPSPLFGLTADTQDELHAFAPLVTRHYLLTEGQRYRAVKFGARVITAREATRWNGCGRPWGEKASSELELSAWELNRSRSMKLLSSRLWNLEVAVVDRFMQGWPLTLATS